MGMHVSFAPRAYSGDEWEQDTWKRTENSTVKELLAHNIPKLYYLTRGTLI